MGFVRGEYGISVNSAATVGREPGLGGIERRQSQSGAGWIRGAATPEDRAKKEWETLQGYLYEIGSSTVIGHYNGIVAVNKAVENFELFEAPIVGTQIAK